MEFIENEMSYREYINWLRYFDERPPGWEEDQRTYMIVSALGAKEPPERLFPTLNAMKKSRALEEAQAMQRMMQDAPDIST